MRELLAEQPRMSPALLVRIEERLRQKYGGTRHYTSKPRRRAPQVKRTIE